MKKQFLAVLCVFAINGIAGCSSSKVISEDETQAVSQHYRKAAEQNDAGTQTRLTAMEEEWRRFVYYKGPSETYFSENCPWHLAFLQQAAQQGYVIAQSLLGACYFYGKGIAENESQAMDWVRKAAEKGHAPAQYNLGLMYFNGNGKDKDEVQAAAWFRKAAEQGFALAQALLGTSYRDGKGVTKDDAQAVAWFRKAAEQGLVLAQYNLGFMYEMGRGITKDNIQAAIWYHKAVEQGYALAQIQLMRMYESETQAGAWFRKAAEQGRSNAQSNVGLVLRKQERHQENGQIDHYQVKGGLVQDTATGLMWMRCSLGQNWNDSTCQGDATEYHWEQAMNTPKHFDYAGYNDWRVPTREELNSLVYCGNVRIKTYSDGTTACDGDYAIPTIVQAAFPKTPSIVWSSSPDAGYSRRAWFVHFNYGFVYYDFKDYYHAVRLVRSGQ